MKLIAKTQGHGYVDNGTGLSLRSSVTYSELLLIIESSLTFGLKAPSKPSDSSLQSDLRHDQAKVFWIDR